MTTTTISAFRANIRKYVESVINGQDAVVINRGHSGAVLISLEEYNSIKATERVLSNQTIANALGTCSNEDTIEVDANSL